MISQKKALLLSFPSFPLKFLNALPCNVKWNAIMGALTSKSTGTIMMTVRTGVSTCHTLKVSSSRRLGANVVIFPCLLVLFTGCMHACMQAACAVDDVAGKPRQWCAFKLMDSFDMRDAPITAVMAYQIRSSSP